MAKQIILYNLAENVTDEQYEEYVKKEKGPLLDSLSSVKKFELVKIVDSGEGKSPYRYIGIMHLTSMEDFIQKDAPSEKFQGFMKKWLTFVSAHILLGGNEIY
jgi:hypothetical protein